MLVVLELVAGVDFVLHDSRKLVDIVSLVLFKVSNCLTPG